MEMEKHLIRCRRQGEAANKSASLAVLNIYEIVFAISHKSGSNFTLGCALRAREEVAKFFRRSLSSLILC